MKPETDAKGVSREAAAGLTLLAAAVLALIVANSPLRESYESLILDARNDRVRAQCQSHCCSGSTMA